MKHTKLIALLMALILMTASACSAQTAPQETPAAPPVATEPETQEPDPTPPQAAPVTEEDIKMEATPVAIESRPAFEPKDKVTDGELISLQGYTIGMTFKEANEVWEIPQAVVDYGKSRWTAEYPSLCLNLGNMYVEFRPKKDADPVDFDSYTLYHIYYGESVFGSGKEPLSVLRDIKLGDSIGDALKSLPGSRTPRKWALDELYGEYQQPGSASLEYITNLGFYDLRIYCENSFAILSFHSDGNLWIADVYANEE